MHLPIKRCIISLVLLLTDGTSAMLHACPCIQTVSPLIQGGSKATGEMTERLIAITRVHPYTGRLSVDSTGYQIQPELVLTTGHSVDSARCSPLLALHQDPAKPEITYLPVLGSYRSPGPRVVAGIHDLAVLRVSPSQSNDLQLAARLEVDTILDAPDKELFLVGWSKSPCTLIARSISLRREARATADPALLLAQAENVSDLVSRGNSGSPVVTITEGCMRLAGIAAYYVEPQRSGEAQTIGIIPVNYVNSFLSEVSTTEQLHDARRCRFVGTISEGTPLQLRLDQAHSTSRHSDSHGVHVFSQTSRGGTYQLKILSEDNRSGVLTVSSISQSKLICRGNTPSVSFPAAASEAFIVTLEIDSFLAEGQSLVELTLELISSESPETTTR